MFSPNSWLPTLILDGDNVELQGRLVAALDTLGAEVCRPVRDSHFCPTFLDYDVSATTSGNNGGSRGRFDASQRRLLQWVDARWPSSTRNPLVIHAPHRQFSRRLVRDVVSGPLLFFPVGEGSDPADRCVSMPSICSPNDPAGAVERSIQQWANLIGLVPSDHRLQIASKVFRRPLAAQAHAVAGKERSRRSPLQPLEADSSVGKAGLVTPADERTLSERFDEVNANPDNSASWRQLALAHVRAGQWPQAESALANAIQLGGRDSNDPEIYLQLSHCLRQMNQGEDALDVLGAALARFPIHPKLLASASALRVQLGYSSCKMDLSPAYIESDRGLRGGFADGECSEQFFAGEITFGPHRASGWHRVYGRHDPVVTGLIREVVGHPLLSPFDLLLVGGVLEPWPTWDIDLVLVGCYQPSAILKALGLLVEAGFRHHVFVDASYVRREDYPVADQIARFDRFDLSDQFFKDGMRLSKGPAAVRIDGLYRREMRVPSEKMISKIRAGHRYQPPLLLTAAATA